jgi:hypothetical protein
MATGKSGCVSTVIGTIVVIAVIMTCVDKIKDKNSDETSEKITTTSVSSPVIGTWVCPQDDGRYLDELRFINNNTCTYRIGGTDMVFEYSYTYSGARIVVDDLDVFTLDGNILTSDYGRVFRKR